MTLHIEIDEAKCAGYGNCVADAPDVFDLDPDTNIAFVVAGHPQDRKDDDIEQAAADCPVRAILLTRA